MCCGKEEGTQNHSDQVLYSNARYLFYFILFESNMLDAEVK
jgi:hypothetical protein